MNELNKERTEINKQAKKQTSKKTVNNKQMRRLKKTNTCMDALRNLGLTWSGVGWGERHQAVHVCTCLVTQHKTAM